MKGTDYKVGRQIKLLAKGNNGSGKSRALMTWAKKGPLYHFDVDGRFESVANAFRNRPDILSNVETVRYDNAVKIKDQLKLFRDGHCHYKTIFVDGLTPIGRNALNASIEERVANYDANEIERNKDMRRGGVWVPQIQDFGGEAQAIADICMIMYSEKFETRGINVFLSAHVVQMDHKDRSGKITHTSMRLLTGGKTIAAEIPNYFNEIWHFEGGTWVGGEKAGKPYYQVVTKDPDENHFAKTSMNLPQKIDHTDVDLCDLIQGYIDDPDLMEKEKAARGGWS